MTDQQPADLPGIALRPKESPLAEAERKAILADPGFGRHFTDHMVTIRWSAGRGWHDAELVPYGPIALDPATMVLHYGQEIFEGLKAYRQADGSIATFRPEENAAPLPAVGPPARRCPSCPTSCSSARSRRSCRPTRRGCRTAPSARSTCGRSCSPPRWASACGRPTSTSSC